MLLDGRNAIIYGGAGSIGSAIARAYAAQGARVFLAGRTRETLEKVGLEFAVVDALDERAVDDHADAVAAEAGSIDISVNVIADDDVQGTPMADMPLDDYLAPVVTSVRSKFLTARAAARHMRVQRSGVILTFGGSGDRTAQHNYLLGGLQTGFDAIEAMRRQLAVELGEHGIRVITLQTGGVPEAIPEAFEGRAAIEADLTKQTLLGRTATLEDVGHVAVFAASDWARTITGAALNMTCGAVLD
ncbi:SDR family NAD(P)-dependent oxidoreductase [Actinoplanes friuliensis]|uniref:3-oxoacyl-[acyl-carrier-protein] reductase n=1 Tax=Actinoplanes friuliensis DSM 7358 TaxID=1246995 RepID=U5WD80_9ACTN|nr:SDR family oxidoreductase [Actinoplanes friuliensis]AGZ45980.1 3-oxoacyl-[acyl-carrier-protein] reductase [Actinoplanes friuliensis DSM 7358]